MPPPRKKRPPAGQSVPDAGTISAHRDALRRSSGAAGQKPPGRGRKNSPRRSRRLCAGCAHVGMADIMCGVVSGRCRTEHPVEQRARPGAKTAPSGGRELCADCAHGRAAGNKGVWYREVTARAARRGKGGTADIMCGVVPGRHRTGHPPGQRARPGAKQSPARAGDCLDAGYGCYLPRAIRVIWMHRVGSTARPRIMPS